MSVKVRLPTMLRRHAGGQASIEANGTTLGEVFIDIAQQHPDLGAALVGEGGEMHRFINVYLNDDDVRFLGKLETKVSDGDSVTILPAVAGG